MFSFVNSEERLDPKTFFLLHLLLMLLLLTLEINTLLASGLSEFFNKGNPVFSNGPKSLPKDPPDSPILCN